METHTLYQLNEYIRRVIALNFDDKIWISAEISQVKFSRGNYYLDLIQKEENSDKIIAQSSAKLWYKNSLFIRTKFKDIFDSILDTGNEIRVKVGVEFSERYGLSLIIHDLDASFTIGKAELLKQEIISKLLQENLLDVNASLPLTPVLQNIAVISSETAAGYKDFMNHLDHNSYGYYFRTQLFHCAVQGTNVEHDVVDALGKIAEEKNKFDVVIIIRGGGSKLDLAGFDNYAIAKSIAQLPVPVLTGIGHEIDNTVADLVSHTSLKTPTAAADFLINHNLSFESRILDLGLKIQMNVKDKLAYQGKYLELYQEKIINIGKEKIRDHEHFLREAQQNIRFQTDQIIKKLDHKFDIYTQKLELLSPENVLKKGYAIIRQNDKIIKEKKAIDKNQAVEIQFTDGTIKIK